MCPGDVGSGGDTHDAGGCTPENGWPQPCGDFACHAARVTVAAADACSALADALTEDLAGRLTCSEVEAVARLYRALGLPNIAADVIEQHAEADEEGDDHWQGHVPRSYTASYGA